MNDCFSLLLLREINVEFAIDKTFFKTFAFIEILNLLTKLGSNNKYIMNFTGQTVARCLGLVKATK